MQRLHPTTTRTFRVTVAGSHPDAQPTGEKFDVFRGCVAVARISIGIIGIFRTLCGTSPVMTHDAIVTRSPTARGSC